MTDCCPKMTWPTDWRILAKTKLVVTLAQVLSLDSRRVQFTPDVMPADILGSEVLEESENGRRSFRFIRGPIFCQLLMADEINRASPRTQSALLQALQEYHVSVAGERHDLARPFHVLATQNPLEQEGARRWSSPMTAGFPPRRWWPAACAVRPPDPDREC